QCRRPTAKKDFVYELDVAPTLRTFGRAHGRDDMLVQAYELLETVGESPVHATVTIVRDVDVEGTSDPAVLHDKGVWPDQVKKLGHATDLSRTSQLPKRTEAVEMHSAGNRVIPALHAERKR